MKRGERRGGRPCVIAGLRRACVGRARFRGLHFSRLTARMPASRGKRSRAGNTRFGSAERAYQGEQQYENYSFSPR